MPYLSIKTNTLMDQAEVADLAEQLTAMLAEALSKPEKVIMVAIQPNIQMSLAGNDDPCAFLELRSINLADDSIPGLSQQLTDFVKAEMWVPPERVFLNFFDMPPNHWGWNGKTLG